MSSEPFSGVTFGIGPISEVTVVVPDLDLAVRRYVEGLGWSVRSEVGCWGRGRARRWDAPGAAEARTVRVGPADGAAVGAGVCLVECPDVAVPVPLTTFGWSALEVCVLDAEAACDRAVAAGWRLLRAPARLASGRLPLVAGQVAGPGGEAVYLTQILDDVPNFDLPRARQQVDGVFIAVLGAADLVATRAYLERRFAVTRASDRQGAIGVLNLAFGRPSETTYRLSTLQLDGKACIEIDELPAEARDRPRSAGGLPAAVAGVSVAVGGEVPAEVVSLPGGALLELVPAGEAKDLSADL
ncbi:VOC family protein [Micromonospora sp. NPDC047074]|uniref:VOC family protein n=1 Tax=Micromonospora sp. NPDC047074 TaxID=3154339 RepID=UPI0033DB31BD